MVEGEFDINADTLWQAVFDLFPAYGQTCIRDRLGGELLESVLGLRVMSGDALVGQWVVSIPECLNPETAADLFMAVILASMTADPDAVFN